MQGVSTRVMLRRHKADQSWWFTTESRVGAVGVDREDHTVVQVPTMAPIGETAMRKSNP